MAGKGEEGRGTRGAGGLRKEEGGDRMGPDGREGAEGGGCG